MGNVLSPAEQNIVTISEPFEFCTNKGSPTELSTGKYRVIVTVIVLEDQNYEKIKESPASWFNMDSLKELSGEKDFQNNYIFSDKSQIKY